MPDVWPVDTSYSNADALGLQNLRTLGVTNNGYSNRSHSRSQRQGILLRAPRARQSEAYDGIDTVNALNATLPSTYDCFRRGSWSPQYDVSTTFVKPTAKHRTRKTEHTSASSRVLIVPILTSKSISISGTVEFLVIQADHGYITAIVQLQRV